MFPNLRFWHPPVVLTFVALGSMTNNASAVTVDVAKKCNGLTAKAYPPRVVGNPAAGSAKGTPQLVQDYFKKCLENGGNTDDHVKDAK